MQTARRLYFYLLSGISLGVLVAGTSMMFGVLFDSLGLGTGPVVGGDADFTGEQLTLASALIAVSLPVWLVHWLAVERSVRPDRPGAAIERTADLRGLYFALAMGLLLLVAALGIAALVESAIIRLAGADEFGGRDLAGSLSLALVAGAAWLYHLRVRSRDWARGPMTGGSAWLPRTYLYLAAFVGLVLMLGGIGQLLGLVGQLLVDQPTDLRGSEADTWWAYPLASALGGLLIGGAIWVGHMLYAGGLIRDSGWRGDAERPAKLRLAYFVAALVATASGTLFYLAEGIGNAMAAVLGVSDGDGAAQVVGLIVVPLLTAVPYAIGWRGHARGMEAEAATSGSAERVETEDRLERYPVALVGLAFGAVATAWLIGLLIDLAFGASPVLNGSEAGRSELAQFVPLALIGAAAWIWAWRGIGVRWAVDPVGEAASTTRRASLLIVLAISVLAGIASAGFILYRIFGSLFGIDQPGDPVSELSRPIGVLVVAVAVAAYHAVQLRRDQALRASVEPAPAAAEPAAQQLTAAVAMRLTGPAEGDLGAVVASLRAQLPPGFDLEMVPPPG